MILRDPVHGLLAFESSEDRIVEALLDTPEVQRLRRIRQLGMISFAFPGAEHTRFAHALGTAHVMQCLLRRLHDLRADLSLATRLRPEHRKDALAAALLHDVGHGPFSHLFEQALPGMAKHEVWSSRMLLDQRTTVHRVLSQEDAQRPERVARLLRGEHDVTYLAHAVSGTFDVDRCDYLLRDAHATGVHYGHFDLDWLLRSLCFGSPPASQLAPPLAIDGAKGLTAVEAFVLARLFMFQQVYFHKASRAAQWMIRTALSLAVHSLAQGDSLPGTPTAFRAAARGEEPELFDYMELDDMVLWNTLRAWENAAQPTLADLCRRIRARSLFKTLELFGSQQHPARREEILQLARELATQRDLDPDAYVGLDVAEDVPFDDARMDVPMVKFAKGPSRRLADVSFLLNRLNGERVAKVRLIFAPELRDAILRAVPT